MERQYSNNTLFIKRSEFENGYTIFVFDLLLDKSILCVSTPTKNGAVRFKVKFGAASARTTYSVSYAKYDKGFTIDKHRKVLIFHTTINFS